MRILVVEDDRPLASVISRGLRKLAYAVDVVHDGEQALIQIETTPYDVVLLDLMLPIRDGIEVCRMVRSTGNDVAILMLTARDSVSDRVAGLETGADDYLVKPFDFDELAARIRALLRRRGTYQTELLRVGPLTLDTSTHLAERNGEPIELTTKEYAMLEFMMVNAHRVVGRAEIAEHVWDANYDPFSNVIDVYIRRLRLKIDTDEQSPLIHTRRGAGYVLTDRSVQATNRSSSDEE